MDSLGLMSVSAMSGGAAPSRIYAFDITARYDSNISQNITLNSFKYGIVTITRMTRTNSNFGGLPSNPVFYIGPNIALSLSISGDGSVDSAKAVGEIVITSAYVMTVTAYQYSSISGSIAIFT